MSKCLGDDGASPNKRKVLKKGQNRHDIKASCDEQWIKNPLINQKGGGDRSGVIQYIKNSFHSQNRHPTTIPNHLTQKMEMKKSQDGKDCLEVIGKDKMLRRKSLSTSNLKRYEDLVDEFPTHLPTVNQLRRGPIICYSTHKTLNMKLLTKIIDEPQMTIYDTEELVSEDEMDCPNSSDDSDSDPKKMSAKVPGNPKAEEKRSCKDSKNVPVGPFNFIAKAQPERRREEVGKVSEKPSLAEERKNNILNVPHQGRSRMSIVLERSMTMSNEVVSNFNVIEKIDGVTMMDILRRKVVLTFPRGRKTGKTLLLDMDETLIHTLNPGVNYPKSYQMGKIHTLNFIDPFNYIEDKIDIVIRPYAVNLLQEMHPLCEIIIFTAGIKPYADCILDFLDFNRDLIDHRLYRDRCVRRENYHVKDLRIFQNRKLENMIIVDNSVVSFANQLDNGIHVSSFVGNKNDKELLDLIPVLKNLMVVKDVRPELTTAYCMPELYKLHTNQDLDIDISGMETPNSKKNKKPDKTAHTRDLVRKFSS